MSEDILPPPPEKEVKQMNIRVPISLFRELDEIAKKSGHERTDVVLHLLRWAARQWQETQKGAGKKPGNGGGSVYPVVK